MKVNWKFLEGGGAGGGGAKQKTFCGGSMDIFWNCMHINPLQSNRFQEFNKLAYF